jgi:hypothetical protein
MPVISHTVPFLLDSSDGHAITQWRTDARDNMPEHRSGADGTHLQVGHDVSAGEVFAMIVTRVSGPTKPVQQSSTATVLPASHQIRSQ